MFVQPSMLQTGVSGIQKGVQGLQESAQKVVSVTHTDEGSAGKNGQLYEGLIGLNVYEIQTKASAKVVKVADDLIGTLINIKT